MKYVCVSASNVEAARGSSASLRACQLLGTMVQAEQPDAVVEIVPLLDYEMKSCRMCGKCFDTERCALDPAFNQVFEKMISADGLFVVVPHYAPLPSKVMILLEKMEEMAFLGWSSNPEYRFPLFQKPIGIVAHGGQNAPEAIPYYQKMIVVPLAMAFASCQLQVVGAGPNLPRGVAFGIKEIARRPDSIFVDITHDWDAIQRGMTPLAKNVTSAARLAVSPRQ